MMVSKTKHLITPLPCPQKKCSALMTERDKEIRAISAKYEALQEPLFVEVST